MADRSILMAMAVTLLGLNLMTPAWADMRLVPKVSLREDYNSNLFLTEEDELEDYITTLGAGFAFMGRDERGQVDASAIVAPYFYRDYNELDETDAECNADLNYRLTPTIGLEAAGGWRIDHRTDREIESTGLVLGNERRTSYHGRGHANWVMNEKNGVAVSYDYDQDDWRAENESPPDFKGHTASLDYVHDIGPRPKVTQVTINAGYGWYDYENERLESSFMALGLQHRMTELLRLRVYGGARYHNTHQDQPSEPPAPPVADEEDEWAALGGFLLSYNGEKTRYALTLSHDLRAAGGTDGPSSLSRALVSVNRRILERLAVGLSASYFLNKAEADEYFGSEIDQRTLNLRPYLRWEFLEHFALETAYTYTFLDDAVTDEEAQRHIVYIQLTFGYSLLDYLDVSAQTGRSEFSGAYPWSPLR